VGGYGWIYGELRASEAKVRMVSTFCSVRCLETPVRSPSQDPIPSISRDHLRIPWPPSQSILQEWLTVLPLLFPAKLQPSFLSTLVGDTLAGSTGQETMPRSGYDVSGFGASTPSRPGRVLKPKEGWRSMIVNGERACDKIKAPTQTQMTAVRFLRPLLFVPPAHARCVPSFQNYHGWLIIGGFLSIDT